ALVAAFLLRADELHLRVLAVQADLRLSQGGGDRDHGQDQRQTQQTHAPSSSMPGDPGKFTEGGNRRTPLTGPAASSPSRRTARAARSAAPGNARDTRCGRGTAAAPARPPTAKPVRGRTSGPPAPAR